LFQIANSGSFHPFRAAGREAAAAKRGQEGPYMQTHLAYLDAGSGSLIVQAIVAGTAGAVVAVKLYWRRITGRFRRQPAQAQVEAEKD
jgi:hypothetical protein